MGQAGSIAAMMSPARNIAHIHKADSQELAQHQASSSEEYTDSDTEMASGSDEGLSEEEADILLPHYYACPASKSEALLDYEAPVEEEPLADPLDFLDDYEMGGTKEHGSASDDAVADIHDLPARTVEDHAFDLCVKRIALEERPCNVLMHFTRRLHAAGYGEVRLPSSHLGDIDNEVHPIFRQENWFLEDQFGPDRVEDGTLWQRLQPALRLASVFITHPRLMGWWVRVLLGKRRMDWTTGKRFIEDPGDQGIEGIERVQAVFEAMSQRVRWSFCDMTKDTAVACAAAYSLPSPSELRIYAPLGSPHRKYRATRNALLVIIGKEYRRYIRSDQYLAPAAACAALRVNWELAITMVHELAHQFWQHCSAPRTKKFGEPVLRKGDRKAELGESWEQSIYGEAFFGHSINRTYGILGHEVTPRFRSLVDGRMIDFDFRYPPDPYWLHSFFLKAKWEEFSRVSEEERSSFWHPPPPRVAVTYAPQWRGGTDNWIWLSSEYPDEHRLSVQYRLRKIEAKLRKEASKKKRKCKS
jgi:hypothetical protein